MKTTCTKIIRNIAAVILAACMLATPALAAAGGHNGPGKLFHNPDGSQIARAPLTADETSLYLAWERQLYGMNELMHTGNNEVGTINVAVGETIVLHVSQLAMSYDDAAGPRTIYRRSPDSEIHTEIDTVVQKDWDSFTRGDMIHNQETINTHVYDYYCLEWSITGLSEGVDYLWYQESPFEAEYIKIVVGGSPSGRNSSGSSSAGNGSGGSTSGGTASGGSSSAAALTTTDGGAAYTVQAGDTLGSIALNFYGNSGLWTELQRVNQSNLSQSANGLIFEGFNLILPDTLGGVDRMDPPSAGSGETLYTVKAGDTLGTIALAHYGNMARYQDIYNRNADRLASANTIYEGQVIVLP